jgi:glycosyltransferase involved in cell wall biosynthesis
VERSGGAGEAARGGEAVALNDLARIRTRWLRGPYRGLLRARARRRRLVPGVTVVTVNFNGLPFVQVLVAAVERFAPDARLLVVDNGSTDGSLEWLAAAGIRVKRLGCNIGHGPALDLGFLEVGTEFAVALDIDAFPISDEWLPKLLQGLDGGADVAGACQKPPATMFGREYIHPCCLAMRTRDFVTKRHSFRPRADEWDVGEGISVHSERIAGLPPTSIRGPGAVGTVFGDVVYHNYYSVRFSLTDADRIDWVDRGEPELAWSEAVARYLGPR